MWPNLKESDHSHQQAWVNQLFGRQFKIEKKKAS